MDADWSAPYLCSDWRCSGLIAQFYSAKAAVGFAKELTDDLYRHILSLPKDSRDRLTTSSLVTRLTSDTYQIQIGINQFLRLFLRAPIIVFGAIFMAYRISAELTLWFLVMVVIFDHCYCRALSTG